MSAKYPSPPSSPRISTSRLSLYTITQTFTWMQRIRKAKLIVSSSGPEPITHPALSGAIVLQKAPVHHVDEFTCKSAVDVPRLLRVCRSDLLKLAELVNANTLVDEQWEVIIDPPNNPASGSYKVQIQYSAIAARSETPDPNQPVALDKATSVPGVMTITKRAQ